MVKTPDNRQISTMPRRLKMFLRLIIGVILVFAIGIVFAAGLGDNRFDELSNYVLLFLAIVGFCTLVFRVLNLPEMFSNDRRISSMLVLLDSFEDAIAITDLRGRVIKSNQSFKKLNNYKPKQAFFATISSISDAESVVYRLTVKSLSGQEANEDVRSPNPLWPDDGSKRQIWYNLSAKKIIINEQSFLLWRLQNTSITHEQQEPIFQNLQEAINHLDQAPAGFMVVNCAGNIQYLNATLATWMNVDLAKLGIHTPAFDALFSYGSDKSSWQNIKISIKNAPDIYQFALYTVSEDATYKSFVAFAVCEGEGEDGLYRVVLMPTSTGINPLGNDHSVTNLFNYYFYNATLAIALVDRDGKISKFNRSFKELFSLPEEADQTLSLTDIAGETDRERLMQIMQKTVSTGQMTISTEIALANNSARHFSLQLMGVPYELRDSSENVVVVSAVETTERKTLEDKMAQGQKLQAVGQLAGGIAHDFNNVLTAILMSCDLLLASHRSSDPAHADLINIKNNANRAASLVQQLLAFSRRQTLRPEVVDLTELLSDVRNLLMPLLGSNIQLKFNHGRDLWSVKVDQSSFQRVLMNLVINARDAMAHGGIITITTANISRSESETIQHHDFLPGEYVELAVQDTGTGIPKSVQEKMFEPFFTTKEVGKGTGLGLSMVYGIVKQTGGYIYCDSVEGEGTTFRIYLPRYNASLVIDNSSNDKKNDNNTNQAEKNADLSGTATILLVEDEAAVRMGGVRALQSRGYTVLEAENGLEALDVIDEHNGVVDLVVSDVVMPEMDGPTLLGELRKKYPTIKFVFVSGYAKDAFAKNLPDDAVFGFLSKPFTLKQLAMKVKEMLSDSDIGKE